jgi:integrase/ribosomal protein L40E
VAIQIYCEECRTSNKLDAKKCRKCGAAFGREKTFRVDVSLKGKRITRQAPNLTLAREIESNLKTELLRDEFDITAHKTKKALTLADVWKKYLPWAEEHKKTWKCDYYNYETHLEPRFGNKDLDNLTPLDIERMKMDLRKGINKQGRPFTQATIKHQLVLLKRLYTLAKRWGMYKGENPVDRVEIPKLDNQKTEFMSNDEADRLMKVLDSWPCQETIAFIRFAMFTGTRRGELFKLTWNDVDFERGTVTLRAPKGGKTTTVPVSDSAMNVLKGLPDAKNVLDGLPVTSQYVFPGKDGEQRTDFKKPWQRIRKAAGLPTDFRFHGLRHHFASTLVSNGVDLCVVQGLLTHKDSRTTQRYAHLSPGALQKAAQRSGELLTPKHGQVLKIVK